MIFISDLDVGLPNLSLIIGKVAEWMIATVLKTVGRDERPVGSNPTLPVDTNIV